MQEKKIDISKNISSVYGLTLEEIYKLSKAKEEGRLIILPERKQEGQ